MLNKYLIKLIGIAFIALLFTNCQSDNEKEAPVGEFPTQFTVDIPSSISRTSTYKSLNSDDYSGREIYEHFNNFINVGESAAKFIEEIMVGISSYGLNQPMNFNFTSDEDGRTKNIVVVDNSEFKGAIWQYQLTISDVTNIDNNDMGKALQVFWNNNPVSGIAILKPSNWNASEVAEIGNAVFKVEYSEAGEYGYGAHMVVSIANWEQDTTSRFHMDELKMFVGKTGNIIDVYGNSTHPDAYLFIEEPKGFCWAFVASSNKLSNIGVAEVGLPPHMLNEGNRDVLLEYYSIENVFTKQFREAIFQINGEYPHDSVTEKILINTQAPGFFNADGFIQGGESPSADYDPLLNNINLLTPYNPLNISELIIEFK
jgi:hypothetical protein